MTVQTDRADPEAQSTFPAEPPEDNFGWTGEPQDPDAGGMPAEFTNEPGDGVPGVRQSDDAPPPPAGD